MANGMSDTPGGIQNQSAPDKHSQTGNERLQVSAYNQRVFQLVVENVEDYAVFVVDLSGNNAS